MSVIIESHDLAALDKGLPVVRKTVESPPLAARSEPEEAVPSQGNGTGPERQEKPKKRRYGRLKEPGEGHHE